MSVVYNMAANGSSSGFHTITGHELSMDDLRRLATQWDIEVEEVTNRLTQFNSKGGVIPRSIRIKRALVIPLWIDENGNTIRIKADSNGGPALDSSGRFTEWSYDGIILDLVNQERVANGRHPLTLSDPESGNLIDAKKSDINQGYTGLGIDGSFESDQENLIDKQQKLWQSGEYIYLDEFAKLAKKAVEDALKLAEEFVKQSERNEKRARATANARARQMAFLAMEDAKKSCAEEQVNSQNYSQCGASQTEPGDIYPTIHWDKYIHSLDKIFRNIFLRGPESNSEGQGHSKKKRLGGTLRKRSKRKPLKRKTLKKKRKTRRR